MKDNTAENPDVVYVGIPLSEFRIWECSPQLRWNQGTLQQLWVDRAQGKTEWRDVPQAEEGE